MRTSTAGYACGPGAAHPRLGIIIENGSPELTGNTVEGASGRGIAIAGAAPILRDNTVCGDGTDLWVNQWATPDIDDSNEICVDAAAE